MNRAPFARISRMFALLAVAAGLSASLASADTFTWSGASSINWSDSANWGGTLPGSADVALLNNYNNQPTIDSPSSVGGLWYTGSAALTVGAGANLQLNGTAIGANAGTGLEVDAGAGALTLAAPVTLGGSQQWLNNSSNPFIVSGNVADNGGGYSLTLAGSGTTVLAALNTYTGGTVIKGGLVRDGISTTDPSYGPFGAWNYSATAITIQNGATLDLAGRTCNNDFRYGLTISGPGTTGQGALINSGSNGSNGNIQCPNITLGADAAVGGTGDFYMLNSSNSAGTLNLQGHTLTKTGTNTFYLDNTTVTAGTVNISQGTLSSYYNPINGGSADFFIGPSGTLLLGAGGTSVYVGSLSGSGVVTSSSPYALSVGNNNKSATFDGTITGSLTKLAVAGTGVMTLTGSNSYWATTINANSTLQIGNGGNTGTLGTGSVTSNGVLAFNYGSGNIATVSNTVSGGTVMSSGPGTVWLKGANTYSTLYVSVPVGTVRLGNANALGSTSGTVSVSGGTLDLYGYSPTAGTVALTAGSIVNSGASSALSATKYVLQGGTASAVLGGASAPLTVSGGIATLTSSNSYGGGTTIATGGTLSVRAAGGLGSGPVTIQPTALLDVSNVSGGYTLSATKLTAGQPTPNGSADINGSINLPAAATLAVAGTNVGTLTIGGNLGLTSANVSWDVGDLVNVANGGTLTLNGTTVIQPTSWLSPGTYTLFNYGSISGGTANLAIGGTNYSGRQLPYFDTSSGTAVTLTVGAGAAANVVWSGAQSATWDTATMNWLNSGTADMFYTADNVTFGDSASATNITVNGTVQPGSVGFTNQNLSYSLSGGCIGGNAGLTISGSGGVTLSASNSYAGGTTLTSSAGLLTLNAANAIGSGPLTMSGGTLTSYYAQSPRSVALSGGLLNLAGSGGLGSGTLTFSGGTLANTSGTAMTFSGNNTQTWSGSFALAAGKGLNLGTGAVTVSNSPTLTVASGSLTVGGAIALSNSSILTVAGGGATTFSGGISGAGGGLTMNGVGGMLTLTVGSMSPNNSYTGPTAVSGGTLVLASNSGYPGYGSALPDYSAVVIGSGGALSVVGASSYNPLTGNDTVTVRGGGVLNFATSSANIPNTEGYLNTINLDSSDGSAATVTSPNGSGTRMGYAFKSSPASVATYNSYINSWGAVSNTYSADLRLYKYSTSSLVTLSASNTLTMAGPIDDYTGYTNCPVAITGPGTVVFAGSNTYGGPTTISGGTLQLGGTHPLGSGTVSVNGGVLDVHGSVSASSGSISVASGSSIVDSLGHGALNAAGYTLQDCTVSASLGGASSPVIVNPKGSGTVVLSASNTYGGGTTIPQGTLALRAAGALGSGVTTLSSGALLDVSTGYTLSSGTLVAGSNGSTDVSGSLNVALGGYVSVAGDGTPGTMTVGGTLALSGGNLSYDLGSAGTDLVNVNGPLSLTGKTCIDPTAAVSPGTYTILTANSISGGTANLAVGGPYYSGRQAVSFLLSGGTAITMTFGSQQAASLTWTGSLGNTWDTQTTKNWFNPALGGTGGSDKFYAGDNVTFGDSASTTNITLGGGTVSVGSMTFASSRNYTLGNGHIGGGGGLEMQGTGNVTLTSSNSYLGGTTLDYGAGLLTLSASNAIGTGPLTINGGTVNASYAQSPSSVTVGTALLNLNAAQAIGTGPLTITGGTVNANYAQSPNSVTLYAGLLNLNAAQAVGAGPLTITGGTVNAYYPQSPSAVTLSDGLLNLASSATIGAGPLSILGGTLANTSGADMTFTNNNPQTWSGSITIANANSLNLGTGTVALNSYSYYSGTSGPTVTVSGGTLTVGGPICNGTDQNTLTIAGAGTTILAANNTYSGATTVSGGLVICGAIHAFGAFNTSSDHINVNPGATIDLAGWNIKSDFYYGLTIAGTGTTGQGALINSVPGYDDPYVACPIISLSDDATVGGNGGIAMYPITSGTKCAGTLNLNGRVLTKTGTGQFYLINTEVTAGTVNIAQGIFGVRTKSGTLPSDASAADFVLSGGTLCLNNDTFSVGSLSGNSGAVLLNNTLTVGGTNDYSPTASASTFAGTINGPGGLTKSGPGVLTLSGSNNYTGATTIAGGTLQVGSANAIPHGAGTGIVTVSSAGVLDVASCVATVNGLSGAGIVDNSSTGTASLVVGNGDATSAFAGVLQNSNSAAGGLLALTKVGSGTLTLSGTNTYLGGTTVEGGTLILSNNEAIADGTSLTVGDPSLFKSPVAYDGVVGSGAAGGSDATAGISAAPVISPVPEPGTLVLLAAALAVAGLCRKRPRQLK